MNNKPIVIRPQTFKIPVGEDKYDLAEFIPDIPPRAKRFCYKCGYEYSRSQAVAYSLGDKYPTCWKCGAHSSVMFCSQFVEEFNRPPVKFDCSVCDDRYTCWTGEK